ncbi:MAG TPA: hypothetical protein VN428_01780 [Bryobacteraceae bacterium]|nr:hypothetical protein [Bryobacteraceae bacterium]
MKLGTENRNKVILLGVLFLVLAYFLYTNVFAPDDDAAIRAHRAQVTPTRQDPVTAAGLPTQPEPEVRARPPIRGAARTGMQFKMSGAAKGMDLASVDPTLRLDLLAKVQHVNLQGGERNLFQFGAVPMPKTPEPKIIPSASPAPVPVNATPAAPVKPQTPPIPLRFYGYSQARPGERRAFFLDGEEIIVATEGEVVRRRYKVVRIGINSVVMEDTQSSSQQTLPLQEPVG